MSQPAPFFIGWSRTVPAEIRRFAGAVGMLLVLGVGGLGLLLGMGHPSPRLLAGTPEAGPRPLDWLPDQTLSGTYHLLPVPMLWIEPDAGHPSGRSVLLSGDGKHSVANPAMAGRRVTVTGGLLQRGDIAMLVSDDPPTLHEGPGTVPGAVPLGRWRAAGEICDGKCYSGGMKPGSGLAHRACARLCLTGEVPAVFVVASPIAGHSFLLLAAADGGPPPAALRDRAALPVVLEGDVERRGDMLVLRVADIKRGEP